MCGSSFYCDGSVLNSALYEAGESLGMEDVGRYILAALPTLRSLWLENREANFVMSDFLNAIIDQTADVDKATMCSSFTKWFDQSTGVLNCT